MVDPNKLVGIPKMDAGEKLSAAAELDKLCAPTPSTLSINAEQAGHYAATTVVGTDKIVTTPKPRIVQPDPEFYWADDYGNIWRQAVEPIVILSVTSGCTIAELGTILAALLGSRG